MREKAPGGSWVQEFFFCFFLPCICWRAAGSESWCGASPGGRVPACAPAEGCAPGGPGPGACDPKEGEESHVGHQGQQQQQQQLGGRGSTWMFWASTLAPAPSSTCAESTFPASTAQWSGVLRFSLSAALTEAWFLIRKLLGSVLGTYN